MESWKTTEDIEPILEIMDYQKNGPGKETAFYLGELKLDLYPHKNVHPRSLKRLKKIERLFHD